MTKGYEQRKAANARYLATQDEIKIRLPKGQKDEIRAYAEAMGESLNSFIVRLIREEMEEHVDKRE